MTAPSTPTPATLDAAVEAALLAAFDRSAFRMLTPGDIARVVVPVLADQLAQAHAAGTAAGATAERERIEREIFPLVMATRVCLSKGCMCDYYYGTDGCTGRGDCWTPMAWTLNPADVRAAIARAGTSEAGR